MAGKRLTEKQRLEFVEQLDKLWVALDDHLQHLDNGTDNPPDDVYLRRAWYWTLNTGLLVSDLHSKLAGLKGT